MASPTWDYGELQADWEDVWAEIDALDLSGIQMAFFGCGDQVGYPEWYQDAMGLLHDKCIGLGATAIGLSSKRTLALQYVDRCTGASCRMRNRQTD